MKNLIKITLSIALSVAMIFLSSCGKKGIPTDLKIKLDKYIEYWNTGQFKGIDNVLCADYEMKESPNYEPQKGIDLFEKNITRIKTMYPDFHLTVDEMVYENDKIALIWSILATNTGPGWVQPTGKILKGKGISLIHLKNGKIKDEWLANNNILWMTQLGFTFIPPKTESKK
jgi:predicted ester cyclase